MTVGERIDSSIDKAKGKGNQLAGEAKGDDRQKMRGHAQELKGDMRDVKTDMKESFRRNRRE